MSRFLRQSEPIIGSGSLATLASTKPQFDPYADCVQCGRKLPNDRFTTCSRACYRALLASWPIERQVYVPPFLCDCGKRFESASGMGRHKRQSPKHKDSGVAEPPVRGPGKNGA